MVNFQGSLDLSRLIRIKVHNVRSLVLNRTHIYKYIL